MTPFLNYSMPLSRLPFLSSPFFCAFFPPGNTCFPSLRSFHFPSLPLALSPLLSCYSLSPPIPVRLLPPPPPAQCGCPLQVPHRHLQPEPPAGTHTMPRLAGLEAAAWLEWGVRGSCTKHTLLTPWHPVRSHLSHRSKDGPV